MDRQTIHAHKKKGKWVLNFGKYRGKTIQEVPTSYLEWMLENVEGIVGSFRKAVLRRINKRQRTAVLPRAIEEEELQKKIEDAQWYEEMNFGDQ